MKYTRIPEDTFKNIQLNAGILVRNFVPATGEISGMMGATTGGLSFTTSPSYSDWGDDIDNAPKNTKELKKQDDVEVKLEGTFVTVNVDTGKTLVGPADIDPDDDTKIVPRRDLEDEDFEDIWWVGDYSDNNNGANAGYVAIHMFNALNTGGFALTTTDKGKGQFAFSFQGHYSMEAQDVVPYEVYIKQGEKTINPYVLINKHTLKISDGDSETLTVKKVPSDAEVTWTSGNDLVASVVDGVATGKSAGNTIVTATITYDGVSYTDTCTVIVEE